MKGTFNQGWWNCFETVAAGLLGMSDQYGQFLLQTLSDAGISRREAYAWLDKPVQRNPKVENIVRTYFLNLP